MEAYKLLYKNQRHQLVLLVVLILYVVLNVQTPPTLAYLIDNIYGNLVIILCSFYLLSNSNHLVGIVALFAAYELIKRSSETTGTATIHKYLPSENKKGVHFSAFNQFPFTLEEEVVKNMAPLISSGGPSNLYYKPVVDNTYNAMDVHDNTSII